MLKDQEGFGLIELMFAMLILTIAVLGINASTGTMSVQAARAELRAMAMQSVDDRIALISVDPRYSLLDSLYETTDSTIAGMPGYSRATVISPVTVTLTGSNTVTYQRVTVSVSGPQLPSAIARTIVLGAP